MRGPAQPPMREKASQTMGNLPATTRFPLLCSMREAASRRFSTGSPIRR